MGRLKQIRNWIVFSPMKLVKDYFSVDFILIWIIFVFVTGLVTVLSIAFGSTELGPALSRGLIASAATTLTILSYRYTVKSNLRDSLNELENVRAGNYVVSATLYGVKWRPRFMTRIFAANETVEDKEEGSHWRDELFQNRTAVKFDVYKVEDGLRPADTEKFFVEHDIDPGVFSNTNTIFPKERFSNIEHPDWNSDEYNNYFPELSHDLSALPNLRPDGLHLTLLTTEGREVRGLSDRVLRRISHEVEVDDSTFVEEIRTEKNRTTK